MNGSTTSTNAAPVRVIGIGDTGVRAASAMADRLRGLAEVTCVDTDSTSLRRANGTETLLIGESDFHGFGSGGDVGGVERATRRSLQSITALVADADSVIIVAGLGGGTGSGAAPVIAAAAKLAGAHVLSLVSTPFEFEGAKRESIARNALAELKSASDAVAPMANDRLMAVCDPGATMDEALNYGRSQAASLVSALASLFSSSPSFRQLTPGHVLSAMSDGSLTFAGSGESSGLAAAAEAAESALNSPSAVSPDVEIIDRAIVMIEAGPELSFTQVAAAMGTVQARLGACAELHMGIRERRGMADTVRVTVFATCREVRRPTLIPERSVTRRTFDRRMPVPMFG